MRCAVVFGEDTRAVRGGEDENGVNLAGVRAGVERVGELAYAPRIAKCWRACWLCFSGVRWRERRGVVVVRTASRR